VDEMNEVEWKAGDFSYFEPPNVICIRHPSDIVHEILHWWLYHNIGEDASSALDRLICNFYPTCDEFPYPGTDEVVPCPWQDKCLVLRLKAMGINVEEHGIGPPKEH